MKIFVVENNMYDTKRVIAGNMIQALEKYRNYLSEHLSYRYSFEQVFESITRCSYSSEYEEEDLIK